MRIRLFAAALLLCASAVLARTSAEVAVGAAAVVPPPYLRFGASVASDGDGYFAVWEDSRSPTSAQA